MEGDLQPKKKICLIDDEADLREIYSFKLSHEGFAVFMAKDGEEGLELIRRERPDVILLDLVMPGTSGIDVLKALAKDAELSRIPVVILSNMDNESIFQEVGKFDTHFYLVKALTTPEKAVDIVREILHGK